MEIVAVIGRVLFASLFILSGINHFKERAGLVGYAKQSGLPMAELAVPASGLMLLLGGLSVLVGFYAQWGVWLLVLFLIPAAFTMHKFWGLSDPMMAQNQQAHFMKNLALAGAALLLAWFGSGPYSLH
jgi:putative oxidoreductase